MISFKHLALTIALSVSLQVFSNPEARENNYANRFGRSLVWSEEFDTSANPDTTVWNFENGFVRNHEDQWYQPQNAYCRNGLLVIECIPDSSPNPLYVENSEDWRKSRQTLGYTSASINTRNKKEFQYGTLEVRARIPSGPGAWPAIWTLGVKNPWPRNGEIDIMEYYRIDGVPHILANAAWGTQNPHKPKWNTQTHPFADFTANDVDWASKFHIWRMDWDKDYIRIYLDDKLVNETDISKTINADGFNPMRQPHYILLNLALGGDNGGAVNHDAFPLIYEVDYVRLYQ